MRKKNENLNKKDYYFLKIDSQFSDSQFPEDIKNFMDDYIRKTGEFDNVICYENLWNITKLKLKEIYSTIKDETFKSEIKLFIDPMISIEELQKLYNNLDNSNKRNLLSELKAAYDQSFVELFIDQYRINNKLNEIIDVEAKKKLLEALVPYSLPLNTTLDLLELFKYLNACFSKLKEQEASNPINVLRAQVNKIRDSIINYCEKDLQNSQTDNTILTKTFNK